ncbi:DUF3152 domain-containing protein [Candidatus Saccharibacteria bacterium]|nr:DUF3152 domain-containing protein [Candidatus Saccharibacteria bacterium]
MSRRAAKLGLAVALGIGLGFGRIGQAVWAGELSATDEAQVERLVGAEVKIPLALGSGEEFIPENPNGTNTASTGTAQGHVLDGEKVIFYRTETWGEIVADFEEFKSRVSGTLEDERGWKRAGLRFVEVEKNPDVLIILSDAARLDATSGCSGDLSCTTWDNEVIINDLRWREGTEASRAAGMETRDYQHMVVNHEVGHWLGHYAHETSCPNGGPAPIMLQQSTGLRGCESFNAWPLESELWTLR